MAKLVSMKISEAERKKYMEAGPSSMATDGPKYPWGLSLNLDTDTLEKLDLDADEMEVGKTLTLVARVTVVSCSMNESQGSKPSQSVGLQLTDLCLEDGDSAKAAARALYNDGDE